MIDRAGQGHSLCEFLLGKSRSHYLSRKHDDFAELCDDENKLGSDSIAVVGPLVAGAAIAIWDRGYANRNTVAYCVVGPIPLHKLA